MRRIITENGQKYEIRDGRRIRIGIDYGSTPPKPPKAHKPFKTTWIKFPAAWHETLHRANSAGVTYDLALAILSEAFKRKHVGGDIVLSAIATRMPKSTRIRAAKELVKLGLIKLHRTSGNQSYRVPLDSITREDREE